MLRDAARVGGLATEVVGNPKEAGTGVDTALVFDGTGDGVFVPVVPIAGWQAFTIQVRFKPDGSGSEEQRFLHLEDEMKHRVLMETRVRDRQWSLDTFLFQDAARKLTSAGSHETASHRSVVLGRVGVRRHEDVALRGWRARARR
jgi:hypothetical protein